MQIFAFYMQRLPLFAIFVFDKIYKNCRFKNCEKIAEKDQKMKLVCESSLLYFWKKINCYHI